jgi:hypothetical protein
MDKTTKANVRKDFAHARYLMKIASEMMSSKEITDYSESSDFGQIANELVASVNTLQVWLDEQQAELNRVRFAGKEN